MTGFVGNMEKPLGSFQAIIHSAELFEKIVESFPYPVQVFSTDGTAIRINRATVEMLGIHEEKHVGIYNVFRDPIVEKLKIAEQVKQVLTGEIVYLTNLNVSYPDMIEYFNVEDRDIQTIFLDITCFPLFCREKTVDFFIAIFIIKKLYQGREEIQKGREYIEKHWNEKFDIKEVARAAHLSSNHFLRLFKKHMGITPYRYYLNVKVDKVQEFLKDENLNIAEAFAFCGLDYHGHYARLFKEKTGLSPSQYRESMKTP